MRLLVGMGNAGWVGRGTPHSFGRAVCAGCLGEDGEGAGWGWSWGALSWYKEVGGCVYLMPGLPMNGSGWCVKQMAAAYDIPTEGILIAADDLRLPFGECRMIQNIKCAHGGLKSIAAHLNTTALPFLRIGAKRVGPANDAPFRGVLTALTTEEHRHFEAEVLPEAIRHAKAFLA